MREESKLLQEFMQSNSDFETTSGEYDPSEDIEDALWVGLVRGLLGFPDFPMLPSVQMKVGRRHLPRSVYL